MARPGVTYTEVAEAAVQLMGQGRNPTVEQVRLALGTGSSTTIANHLRQWRANQDETSLLSSKENIPEELVAVMKGLWEQVLNKSQEKILQVEKTYQETIAKLRQELDKYKSNNQRWQKLFYQWQQEKTALANEKLTLEQALEFARKENQSLQSKQDGLIHHIQEKQERIGELNRLHQQTQANLEHYRESAREQRLLDQQQHEHEKQILQSEIKNLKEELSSQMTKHSKLNQEYQFLNQSHNKLENQYQETIRSITEFKSKIEYLEKDSIESQQLSKHLQYQSKEMETKLENKMSELISLQTDNKLLNQQIIDVKQLLRNIEDRNKLLVNEKWELAREKEQLKGQLKQLQMMIAV